MFMFSTLQNALKENEKLVNLYASRISLVWPLEMHCFRWVEITKTVIDIAKYLFYSHYYSKFYPILKNFVFSILTLHPKVFTPPARRVWRSFKLAPFLVFFCQCQKLGYPSWVIPLAFLCCLAHCYT